MRAKILITVASILIFVAAWAWFKQRKIKAAFAQAAAYTTETDVLSALGNPWRDSKCGEVFGGSSLSGCAREIIYKSPLAPVVPEYWSFSFDSKGKLLDKYHYVSP
jgi:hypothetical protein